MYVLNHYKPLKADILDIAIIMVICLFVFGASQGMQKSITSATKIPKS